MQRLLARRSRLVAGGIAVLLGLAAASASRSAAAQEFAVAFRRTIPPVGRTFRVMQNLRVTLLADELQTAALSRVRDVEILEHLASELAALRVDYREAVVQSGIRYIPSGADCVDGRSYVVRLGADGLAVAPVQGGAPTDAEKDYIRWDLGGVTQVGSLARHLDGRTLRVGAEVPDPGGLREALQQHLMQMGLGKVADFSAQVAEVRDDVVEGRLAVLRIAFAAGEVRFLASTTMQLRGELLVRVPGGDLASLSLDGKLQTVVRRATPLRAADVRSGYFTGTQRVLASLDLRIAGPSAAKPPESVVPSRPPGPEPAGGPDAGAATLGWPREYELDGAHVVMHAPQVTGWAANRLEARLAVAFTPEGAERPLVGVIDLAANTRTNLMTRRVTLAGIRIQAARFPASRGFTEEELIRRLSAVVPPGPMDVALDRILAYDRVLPGSAGVRRLPAGTEVPRVIVAPAPAVLVTVDGSPAWTPIPGTGLETVVNTVWDILRERETGRVYLRAGDGWHTAEVIEGPWRPAEELPGAFRLVPPDHPRGAARAARTTAAAAEPVIRSVTVVGEPAELIDLDGPLTLILVEGTDLLYVANTSRDLFLHLAQRRFYLLASGRWFGSPALAGPWEAAGELPEDFRRIPRDHPRARARYAVPGTPEAAEAVLLAQIPVRAVLDRRAAALAVTFDGAPEFREIRGTDLAYAINSPFDVVRAGSRYYCCYRAAWFVAQSPDGPWWLADRIPDSIPAMPPTSPLFHVSYVSVGDATPDRVAFRYLAGYLGCHVSEDGVVVHGTGIATAPYVRESTYYGWPPTFGLPIRYHPLSGAYGLRRNHGSPYAEHEVRAGCPFARDDSRGPAPSPFAAWGDALAGGRDAWRHAGHLAAAAGREPGFEPAPARAAARAGSGSAGARAGGAATEDLFAGDDGVVYKRMPSGWYQFENDTWTRIPGRPVRGGDGKVQMLGIEEEAQRRERAKQRFHVFESWQRGL